MDDTKELVDAAQVGLALGIASGLGVLLAAALAAAGRGGRSPACIRAVVVCGAAGLLFPLWLVYNAIEDHFGLDSVSGLLTNVLLFVLLGVMLGFGVRRIGPGEPARSERGSGPEDAQPAESTANSPPEPSPVNQALI